MTIIDCPICSGKAEDRGIELMREEHQPKQIWRTKVHVCKNCGAQVDEDGKLFNSKGSEINMFGDTQDYG